ncbi:hypothetical protein QWZ13_09315 [Reinekea marina]|nr:hypothetical protein [Reinekea marina]MDN3649107.1 hypothetical protein [Reinekea marina]
MPILYFFRDFTLFENVFNSYFLEIVPLLVQYLKPVSNEFKRSVNGQY